MKNYLFTLIVICLSFSGFGQLLDEKFDDVSNLPGWTITNQSQPLGINDWFQGNPTVFDSHSGDYDSYIAANFNSTTGSGTISTWLITPVLNIKDGDKLSFWTRVPTGSIWNDRLEVRMSQGTMTLPSGHTGVGSFTNVLMIINDNYNLSYPEQWTKFEITVSGIGETPVSTHFAFRYNVVNGGPNGSDSNYIGIDDVLVEAADIPDPEDPCDSKTIAQCGVEYTAQLVPGEGAWTNYTGVPHNYTGSEKVWQFTASTDGVHTFELNQGTADADFFLMDACDNTAGNVIGTFWSGQQSETVTLTEGVTYYLIADLRDGSGATTVSVKINCPVIEPEDPCDYKTITQCGVEYTAQLIPGEGAWTNYTGVPHNYTGSEKVWQFTASTDGVHTFELNQGTADADFFLMDACDNTAGNVIGTFWSGQQSETVTLTEGVTYYLIADLRDGSGATTVSVKINCPVIQSEDPCDNKTIAQCGVEYSAELIPDSGEWVNYTDVPFDYTGSEKVWQFTAPAQGLYIFELDQGAEDADFLLMDACDNNGINILEWYWTGEQTEYINLDEGQTVYLIADLYSFATAPTTVTVKITCPDENNQPQEPDYDCFQGDGLTSSFDDAYNIEATNLYRVADDFTVSEGTLFTIRQITIDVNQQQIPDMAVINIREDNNGTPGGILETITMSPTSSIFYAASFGDPVYHLTFDLAEPLTFNQGTYWIEPKMSTPVLETVWWLATSTGSHGASPMLSEDDGVTWTADDNGYQMVFFVAGDCEDDEMGIKDMTSSDFSYYPNPVKDVLNIKSEKTIQSVEVFNMTGQKVLNSSRIQNGQIDLSSVNPGIYVIRIILDNKQIETFKINKKKSDF